MNEFFLYVLVAVLIAFVSFFVRGLFPPLYETERDKENFTAITFIVSIFWGSVIPMMIIAAICYGFSKGATLLGTKARAKLYHWRQKEKLEKELNNEFTL